MSRLLSKLFREEDGQDMVEYALILTFLALAAVAVLLAAADGIQTLLGQGVNTFVTATHAAS